MSTLLRRIERLEIDHPARAPVCSECGAVPGEPVTQLAVTFEGDGDDAPGGGPDQCLTCGRKLMFRLEFDERS